MRIGRERIRIKILGLLLLIAGVSIIMYSVLFGSSKFAFWSMYIGFTMVVSALGILGFNVGGFPI